jgi:hypothetical protein
MIMVSPTAPQLTKDAIGQHPVLSISAVLGDQLFSSNIPEDSCVMKVTKDGDSIGVQASASFAPAGLTPIHTTRFIRAD